MGKTTTKPARPAERALGHPVVYARPNNDGSAWVIYGCDFCGETHTHSPWEGLRLAGCEDGRGPEPLAIYFLRKRG